MKHMTKIYIAAANKVRRFISEERGDTNFISILVLLGIALALAGIFIVYKDSVLAWVDGIIPDAFK